MNQTAEIVTINNNVHTKAVTTTSLDNIDVVPNKSAIKNDTFSISTEGLVENIVSKKSIDELEVDNALQAIEMAANNWATTELAASHTRLYRILTSCYEFYMGMKSANTAPETRKIMKSSLENFILLRGMKNLAKTHDMNRVVKAVFGNDRRRVSAYSIALRAALTGTTKGTPVPAKELASWIEEKGGIEEIRSSKKQMGPKPSERAGSVKNHFEFTTPLGTFKPDARFMPYGTEDVDEMSLLLVTYTPTGELQINAVVKNDSAINAALAIYYNEISDTIKQSEEMGTKASKESALEVSLDALAH